MKYNLLHHINGTKTRFIFNLIVLCVIFLFVNGGLLTLSTLIEALTHRSIENRNYQYMFAFHLIIGLLVSLLFIIYLFCHIRHIAKLHNRQKTNQLGIYLSISSLIIILTGFLLTRGIPTIEINHTLIRRSIYTLHLILPFFAIHQFLKHRNLKVRLFPSKPIKIIVIISFIIFATELEIMFSFQPNQILTRFEPSLIKTKSASTIDADTFIKDKYCQQCHADTHKRWQASAHRFSSFNNPFYRFSVNNTRKKIHARDGDVKQSRLCAGCHDIVPLLTGEFDKADFDLGSSNTASVGINCSVCHAITSIDSVKGNADFTIEPPIHYPYAFSDSALLRWFSNVLIKSNPDFHKKTFLKPLHKTSEFCGSCHKVHIPKNFNNYQWLRAQNHYDSFNLSGVSGHSVNSFYYPKKAIKNCQACHMANLNSNNMGARTDKLTGISVISDHFFSGGNTALTHIKQNTDDWTNSQQHFLKKTVSIDIIGIREGGQTNGKFYGPNELHNLKLQPEKTYLLEVVLRTLKLGHHFSGGTSDSNQIWLKTTLSQNGKIIAQNGALNTELELNQSNTHMLKTFLVDKMGKKIDKRNVEDIYSQIYDHQIPPGASDIIHYQFTSPKNITDPLIFTVELNYRKFDSNYYHLSLPNRKVNDLPITIIDKTEFKLLQRTKGITKKTPNLDKRLNDYGIALLRKPERSHFRQAETIFQKVAKLGNEQGNLNLVRLYHSEGRVEDAKNQLAKINLDKLDNPWSAEWYSSLLNIDYGNLDAAIHSLVRLINTDWYEAKAKKFNFALNYHLHNKLAEVYYIRAQTEQPESTSYKDFLNKSQHHYKKTLSLDPENLKAHYAMYKLSLLSDNQLMKEYHLSQYRKYKPDEEAQGKIASLARSQNKNLDWVASPSAIYSLHTQINH